MNGTHEGYKTKAKARLALTPLSSTYRLITPILLIRPIRPACPISISTITTKF